MSTGIQRGHCLTFGEGAVEVEGVLEGGREEVVAEEKPRVKVVVLELEHRVQTFICRVYSLNIGH